MTKPNLPLAVLWDMDGTLIDSEEAWMLAEQQLADSYSAAWTHEDGMDLVGLSLEESSEILIRKLGIHDLSNEAVIDFLTDSVIETLGQNLPWRPGARELLLELKQQGIKTALVTMSHRRMALKVAEAIGFEAFDVVVAGDDVTEGKPHPEPYLKAAELLAVAPQECVAVEDSPTGLASAEAAGCVSLGVQNLIDLPAATQRTIWHTLAGATVEDLRSLCH